MQESVLGGLLFFEGEREFFPLGKEGGALCAEGFEFGGVLLGLVGGGEVAEAGFDGCDGGFEAGNLFFGKAEAVFELLELDGVQALDGGGWDFGCCSRRFGNPGLRIETWGTRLYRLSANLWTETSSLSILRGNL